jgi:hypothetical protein
MPETQEATGPATEPAEIAGGEAPGKPHGKLNTILTLTIQGSCKSRTVSDLSLTFVFKFRSRDEILVKGVGCNIPDVYFAYDIT